jgi:hemerythrin-like metal-binding protein
MTKKLEWEDKYSVGVVELDNQHKRMFAVINELLDSINNQDSAEHLASIVDNLLQYKKFHFATEEKYFQEFNYEGAEEHIKKHKAFGERLDRLKKEYPEFSIEFAFALIDFLEDWLINHLLVVDQKYVTCFHQHGLK